MKPLFFVTNPICSIVPLATEKQAETNDHRDGQGLIKSGTKAEGYESLEGCQDSSVVKDAH